MERWSEGKRDVSAEEARKRFETVLQESKAGQTGTGDVLADGDDPDQPVPEEMVQGELNNVCNIWRRVDEIDEAVMEDMKMEKDKSFGNTCASGTLEAKKLSITGTSCRMVRTWRSADSLGAGLVPDFEQPAVASLKRGLSRVLFK